MIIRVLFIAFLLTSAFAIPLYFDSLLTLLVGTIGIGWVAASILIRLAVILLFFFALRILLSLFERTKLLKSWIVFCLAILPGFGISFIAPIYVSDYGLFNDGMKLSNRSALEQELNHPVLASANHTIVAFFTTSCPHCKAASQRLGTNIESGQSIPVSAIFPGNEEDTRLFLKKNKGEQFQTFRIDNDSLFLALSGGVFPSIFLLDASGKTVYHWIGDELNYSALDYLKSLEQ